jgi:hypothetical protein
VIRALFPASVPLMRFPIKLQELDTGASAA